MTSASVTVLVSPNCASLPAEILLEIVSSATVPAAVRLLQTCKFIYQLREMVSFWISLLDIVKELRPIPALPDTPSIQELREAVILTYKLHVKWDIKRNAKPSRSYKLDPRLESPAEDEDFRELYSWTVMLDDGKHVLNSDVDERVKLRRLDTGEVVWQSHLGGGALGCLDYALYKGDIILIFDVPVNVYQSRMDIWRYKSPSDCALAYSITVGNPLGISWGTRGNFLRDVYCGCVVLTAPEILTAYISNWETGKHVLFDIKMFSDGDPACIFTSTEFLIAFQQTTHAVISAYSLEDLESQMTSTAGATVPSTIPSPPFTTYRVEFEGSALASYHDGQLYWLPQIKEIGSNQFRFVSRTDYRSDLAIVMIVPFKWSSPQTPEAVGGDTVTVIKAPITFLSPTVDIVRSRFREDLWTFGNAKKNIAWIVVAEGEEGGLERFIEIVDVGNASQPPRVENDSGQSGYIGSTFRTLLPEWMEEHGLPLSMDMDDARGRLVCSLPGGALAVVEFI